MYREKVSLTNVIKNQLQIEKKLVEIQAMHRKRNKWYCSLIIKKIDVLLRHTLTWKMY